MRGFESCICWIEDSAVWWRSCNEMGTLETKKRHVTHGLRRGSISIAWRWTGRWITDRKSITVDKKRNGNSNYPATLHVCSTAEKGERGLPLGCKQLYHLKLIRKWPQWTWTIVMVDTLPEPNPTSKISLPNCYSHIVFNFRYLYVVLWKYMEEMRRCRRIPKCLWAGQAEIWKNVKQSHILQWSLSHNFYRNCFEILSLHGNMIGS